MKTNLPPRTLNALPLVSSESSAPSKLPPDFASMIEFAMRYDAPLPLPYWSSLITRSRAFEEDAAGNIKLEVVGRRAGLRPSVLASYLKRAQAEPNQPSNQAA